MSDVVIYGSYGYTGRLIAQEAVDRGIEPVLAGRNRDKVTTQAIELGCESEVVGLDEPKVLDVLLDDAEVCLHCAGPFSRTWKPMVEACLRTDTQYLDITGELDVFEAIHQRDAEAREAGVMLLPGVGFDVVPTDCIAAHLAERLPDADTLELAFHAEMGVSKGTAKTMVEHIDEGGAVRRNGRIERVAVGSESREIDFGWGRAGRHAVSIPWGDVSTAYHTTGIPNVTVYMSMPLSAARQQRIAGLFAPVLGLPPVKATLKWVIEQTTDGPDAQERADEPSFVWGEARTDDGERVESRLRGPHTYDLTAQTALEITERVLGGTAPAGFQTPAGAYGPDLILAIDGVEREDVT